MVPRTMRSVARIMGTRHDGLIGEPGRMLSPLRFILFLALASLASGEGAAHELAKLGKLGTVQFPTSARSDDAQAHFLRGVAALHSFWYPVALDEFRAAAELEPDFAMAYWGQAMTHNHPLWGDPQEIEAARNALSRAPSSSDLPPRERAYLEAVKILYGEGEKIDRDRAYAEAMEEVYLRYPDDREAVAFYALALLGAARSDDPMALRTRMKAGALAQEVYRREPDHPGAAHYILHAFDDPDHAVLALHAARQYAEIAPGAPHALHMPSHIFLQLGLWHQAAASNEASWAASDQWVSERRLSIGERDYHSLQWLFYTYLQQARYREAKSLLTVMRDSLPQFSKDRPYNLLYGKYVEARMAAGYMIGTRQWEAADAVLGPSPAGDTAAQAGSSDDARLSARLARTPVLFAKGFAAAMTGAADWNERRAELHELREQIKGRTLPLGESLPEILEVQELELTAVAAMAARRFDEAIRIMKQATALVDARPPSAGPPPIIKPPHELLGEILLLAGRPEEAKEQFAISLSRHANRAASLLGTARAASRKGDPSAAAHAYAALARQWTKADAQWPEVEETKAYLKEVRRP
jgi:hypothetical protein